MYEPTLLGSFELLDKVLVCERLPPSVLVGRGVVAPASGVIVALDELLLKVFASGARCVSFSSATIERAG